MKKLASKRPPLTDAELEELLPSQLVGMKLSEEEIERVRQMNSNRRANLERFAKLWNEEQALLLYELRDAGIVASNVWDLLDRHFDSEKVVPILVRHLSLPYSDRTMAGIARALSGAGTAVLSGFWPLLLMHYRNAKEGYGPIAPGDNVQSPLGAKEGLACALVSAVTESTLVQLLELCEDPENGTSRILLLLALRKLRSRSDVKIALSKLIKDPILETEIKRWK